MFIFSRTNNVFVPNELPTKKYGCIFACNEALWSITTESLNQIYPNNTIIIECGFKDGEDILTTHANKFTTIFNDVLNTYKIYKNTCILTQSEHISAWEEYLDESDIVPDAKHNIYLSQVPFDPTNLAFKIIPSKNTIVYNNDKFICKPDRITYICDKHTSFTMYSIMSINDSYVYVLNAEDCHRWIQHLPDTSSIRTIRKTFTKNRAIRDELWAVDKT